MRPIDEQLLAAAKAGDEKVIDKLLQNGANVHVFDAQGRTPLHLAAHSNHLVAARTLLRYRANVDAKMEDDGTPLHDAAACGHSEMVGLLLDAGANPMAIDEDGSTALHWAACQNKVATIELIATRFPALINSSRNNGRTPLHEAAVYGHIFAVQRLVKFEANIYSRDKDGKTPSQLAHEGEHDEIVNFLEGKPFYRAQRVQGKFFNLDRSNKLETKALAQDYSSARKNKKRKESPIKADHIPARRLITADAGAVALSLQGLEQKHFGDIQQVNKHARWHTKGKSNQFGSYEYIAYSPNLTICSQYNAVSGHIGNIRVIGVGDYGDVSTKTRNKDILTIINQVCFDAVETNKIFKERALAALLLNYMRHGQAITTANWRQVLKTFGFQNTDTIHLDESTQKYLARICYLTGIKETSRRMHPGVLKDGTQVEEFPMSVAHVMALRLICDGHLRMYHVFDKDAEYGLPTSNQISLNPIAIKLKFSKLSQLFYSVYPQTKATREGMHELLRAYGGDSDTDGDEYSTSDDEASTPRLTP